MPVQIVPDPPVTTRRVTITNAEQLHAPTRELLRILGVPNSDTMHPDAFHEVISDTVALEMQRLDYAETPDEAASTRYALGGGINWNAIPGPVFGLGGAA